MDVVVKGGTLAAIIPAPAGCGEVYQDTKPPSSAQPAEPCVPAQAEAWGLNIDLLSWWVRSHLP